MPGCLVFFLFFDILRNRAVHIHFGGRERKMPVSDTFNSLMESLALYIAKNHSKTFENTFEDWKDLYHPDAKFVGTLKYFGESLYQIDENLIFEVKSSTGGEKHAVQE